MKAIPFSFTQESIYEDTILYAKFDFKCKAVWEQGEKHTPFRGMPSGKVELDDTITLKCWGILDSPHFQEVKNYTNRSEKGRYVLEIINPKDYPIFTRINKKQSRRAANVTFDYSQTPIKTHFTSPEVNKEEVKQYK